MAQLVGWPGGAEIHMRSPERGVGGFDSGDNFRLQLCTACQVCIISNTSSQREKKTKNKKTKKTSPCMAWYKFQYIIEALSSLKA